MTWVELPPPPRPASSRPFMHLKIAQYNHFSPMTEKQAATISQFVQLMTSTVQALLFYVSICVIYFFLFSCKLYFYVTPEVIF